jgi:hypothetical protein
MQEIGPHPTVFLVALLSAMVCAFVLTIMIFNMVGELNGRLPDKESFSYLGWHWSKYKRFIREYNRYFPSSPNLKYLRISFLSMIGLMVVALWGLGFFR